MSQAEWPTETKKLIAATVGKKLNQEALLLLQHVSLSKGLDPLANEIYCIPKGDKPTIIVSINGMLKLCSSQLDGVDSVWFDNEGQMVKVWLSNEPPAACQVSVFRKGCTRPFVASCRFSDYKANTPLWTKMASRMIEKTTTAAALRLAFSDLLSGLYSQEEMDQAGFTPPAAAPAVAPAPAPAPAAEASAAAESLAQATNGVVATASLKNGGQPQSDDPSDSAQPTALEQIRNSPVTAAEPEQLPNRDDLKGALAALWTKAQKVGLTTTGWRAMEHKLGHKVEASEAHKLIKHMTESKAQELNAMPIAA